MLVLSGGQVLAGGERPVNDLVELLGLSLRRAGFRGDRVCRFPLFIL